MSGITSHRKLSDDRLLSRLDGQIPLEHQKAIKLQASLRPFKNTPPF